MSERRRKRRTEATELMKGRARELRRRPTGAEDVLWRVLQARRLGLYKFRRQFVVAERFIADFCCFEHRLIIELDGPIHNRPDRRAYDQLRTEILELHGFRVIRFTNQQVLFQLDDVCDAILSALSLSQQGA